MVRPADEPVLVIEIVTRSPAGSTWMPVTSEVNSPTLVMASRASTARMTTAAPIARNTVPCACDAPGDRRPSGLQRSHIESASAIRAPQRTQPWSGSVAEGSWEGVEVISSVASGSTGCRSGGAVDGATKRRIAIPAARSASLQPRLVEPDVIG